MFGCFRSITAYRYAFHCRKRFRVTQCLGVSIASGDSHTRVSKAVKGMREETCGSRVRLWGHRICNGLCSQRPTKRPKKPQGTLGQRKLSAPTPTVGFILASAWNYLKSAASSPAVMVQLGLDAVLTGTPAAIAKTKVRLELVSVLHTNRCFSLLKACKLFVSEHVESADRVHSGTKEPVGAGAGGAAARWDECGAL